MNENTIRELLTRYMNGETTLAEERVLKGYFAAATEEELPADIAYARAMFGHFAEAVIQKPEKEFGTPAAHIRHTFSRTRRIWAAAVAAAVIVAAILLVQPKGDTVGDVVYCYINGKPVTDFELAYAYTKDAFGLFENNMKKTGEYLTPIEKVGRSIESLCSLELLSLFISGEQNN